MTLAAVMEAHGYYIRSADTGAYNCRYIAGTTTWSNHSTGTAVDVNWQSNPRAGHLITDMPPAMIRAIEAIETVDGIQVFRWGGRYGNSPDAMHYEVMVTPEQLARGIKGIPGGLFMPGEVDEIIDSVQAQGSLTRTKVDNQTSQIDAKLEKIEARMKAQDRKLNELMEKVSALG